MQETAINIAFATSLLRTDMTQYIVNVDSPEVVELEEAGRKEVSQSLLCIQSKFARLRALQSFWQASKPLIHLLL